MGKILGLIVIIIIVVGGVFFWMSKSNAPMAPITDETPVPAVSATDTMASTSGTAVPSTPVAPAAKSVTVSYDGNIFSPASITVSKGDTVVFTDTAGSMWVASDPHPQHSGYDGTSLSEHCAPGHKGAAPFDQCSAGPSFTFTFNKSGSWGYHDHFNHDAKGTVVVK